jgi:hypothetical protein
MSPTRIFNHREVLEDRHRTAPPLPEGPQGGDDAGVLLVGPWEKFSLATSMPASTSLARTPGSREAGPIVQTILVRRISPKSSRERVSV